MKYSIVADKFIEGATAHIKTLKPGASLILVREPTNAFDKNAVAIYDGSMKIGYVPKKQNLALAQFIDQAGTPEINGMAMDGRPNMVSGKFTLSPNSAFPQVEIQE